MRAGTSSMKIAKTTLFPLCHCCFVYGSLNYSTFHVGKYGYVSTCLENDLCEVEVSRRDRRGFGWVHHASSSTEKSSPFQALLHSTGGVLKDILRILKV